MEDPYYYVCAVALWVVGLAISTFGGNPIVKFFKRKLEKEAGLSEQDETRSIPGSWTGNIERALFTGWVGWMGVDSGTGAAMLGWLGLKLASNWHRRKAGGEDKEKACGEDKEKSDEQKKQDKETEIIARTWVALFSGLLSVVLAILIGTALWHGLRIINQIPIRDLIE